MNLLLDFWNNRLPETFDRLTDRWFKLAACRASENMSAVFSGSELSGPKTDQLY